MIAGGRFSGPLSNQSHDFILLSSTENKYWHRTIGAEKSPNNYESTLLKREHLGIQFD